MKQQWIDCYTAFQNWIVSNVVHVQCLPVRPIAASRLQWFTQSECKHLWLLTSVWYNWCIAQLVIYVDTILHRVDCCLVSFTLVWYQIWYAFVLCSCYIVLCLDHGSTCSLLQILIARQCNMNCNELYTIYLRSRGVHLLCLSVRVDCNVALCALQFFEMQWSWDHAGE
jgi:hypothetical protein